MKNVFEYRHGIGKKVVFMHEGKIVQSQVTAVRVIIDYVGGTSEQYKVMYRDTIFNADDLHDNGQDLLLSQLNNGKP
jgi:hypothetical protein